jgi:hypothetical protein
LAESPPSIGQASFARRYAAQLCPFGESVRHRQAPPHMRRSEFIAFALDTELLETPFNSFEPRFNAFEALGLIEKVTTKDPEESFNGGEPTPK